MRRRLWVATLEGWWMGTWPKSPWISANAEEFSNLRSLVYVKNILKQFWIPLWIRQKSWSKKNVLTHTASVWETARKQESKAAIIQHKSDTSQRNTNHLSTVTNSYQYQMCNLHAWCLVLRLFFSAYQPSTLGIFLQWETPWSDQLGVRQGCSAWLLMGLKVAQLLQRTQGIQPEGESSLHAFQVKLRYFQNHLATRKWDLYWCSSMLYWLFDIWPYLMSTAWMHCVHFFLRM